MSDDPPASYSFRVLGSAIRERRGLRATFAGDLRAAILAQLEEPQTRRDKVFASLDLYERGRHAQNLAAVERDLRARIEADPDAMGLLEALALHLSEPSALLLAGVVAAIAPGRYRDELIREETSEQVEAIGPPPVATRRNPLSKRWTRGRRLLLAVLQRTKARTVAARVDVSAGAVSRWASGRGVPSPPARARLEAAFGIPAASWTEPEARR